MRIYVAGPMTGREDWNFPAFFETAAILRELGHQVENPAENDGPTLAEALAAANAAAGTLTWADYMRRDLRRLSICDAVCLLPGWRDSRGATIEHDLARKLGMPIYVLDDDQQLVPRVTVVGLSGYARAGKDTVAHLMVERHGYQQASFAAALKRALYLLNPTIADPGLPCGSATLANLVDTYGWERCKDRYPYVRALLQRMGTEVGRNIFGETVWIDLAFRDLPDGARVVFSDCRFPNEAQAVTAAGGQVWRVHRDGCGPINGHVSETALDSWDFDWHVWNNGPLSSLSSLVSQAVHS